MNGILALDLATVTGWAFARPGEVPVYSSRRLPSHLGDGAFFHSYRRFLLDLVTVHAPALVVYEAPLITGGKTAFQTAFRLFGLACHTVEVCHAREVRCEPANNSTVKKHLTGNGKAEKPVVAAFIRDRYGWDPRDYDTADAIAVLLWAEAKFMPGVPRSAGALFA